MNWRKHTSVLAALALMAPTMAVAGTPDAATDTPAAAADGNAGASTPVVGEETIVVTDGRRARPLAETNVATEVITRVEIESSGAENVAELLEAHPGVEVFRSFRGSAARIHGLDPEYVLVLVDGERAIGRIGGAVDLERFAIEGIERIEIVKGASSALYGSDALAGVINIITRDAERPVEGEARVVYGELATLDLSGRVGLRRGDLRSSTTAGWHRSDGYDLDPATLATTGSAHDEVHVRNRSHYRLTAGAELGVRAGYLLRDQAGIDESATGAVFDRVSRTEIVTAGLDGSWRPGGDAGGGRVSLSGQYSYWRDQYLSDQRGSDALDRYELTREQLAEVKLQYDQPIGERHHTTAGVDGMVQLLRADRLSEDGQRERLALFGQHEWTASRAPYVAVVPGARVDVDSQFGVHASPKLSVRWDADPAWIVRGSYGWGLRAPDFRELLLRFENPGAGYRVEGNPDLEPESARTATLGLEARLHARLWAAASAFHSDIDDLIAADVMDEVSSEGAQVFGYVNIGSARTRGFEARLRARPIAALAVDLAYALTDTLDRDAGTVLPGRARHRGTIGISYRPGFAPVRATARGAVHGARTFFQGDEAIRAEPYAALDGRLEADVHDHLIVFGGIDNALDAGDPALLPIAPRTFYGGVTARY